MREKKRSIKNKTIWTIAAFLLLATSIIFMTAQTINGVKLEKTMTNSSFSLP